MRLGRSPSRRMVPRTEDGVWHPDIARAHGEPVAPCAREDSGGQHDESAHVGGLLQAVGSEHLVLSQRAVCMEARHAPCAAHLSGVLGV